MVNVDVKYYERVNSFHGRVYGSSGTRTFNRKYWDISLDGLFSMIKMDSQISQTLYLLQAST